MEMSAQCGHELDAVDISIEPTLHRSIHPSRDTNLLASPLLRLPTELTLKIFGHAIEIESIDTTQCYWS